MVLFRISSEVHLHAHDDSPILVSCQGISTNSLSRFAKRLVQILSRHPDLYTTDSAQLLIRQIVQSRTLGQVPIFPEQQLDFRTGIALQYKSREEHSHEWTSVTITLLHTGPIKEEP